VGAARGKEVPRIRRGRRFHASLKRVAVRERKQFEEVTHAFVKCVKRNGNERLALWGSYSHPIESPNKFRVGDGEGEGDPTHP